MKTTVLGMICIMFFNGSIPEGLQNTVHFSTELALQETKFQEDANELDMLVVGDIMVHYPQLQSAYVGDGAYDFSQVFEPVRDKIESADISIGNLETVVSPSRKPYTGYPRFNSPPELVEMIANAGFDVLVTANNHTLDQGKTGIVETIETIERNKLTYVGTSVNEAKRYEVLDQNGIQIGIASFATALNGLDRLLTDDERAVMINLYSESLVYEVINELKALDVDLIVVYMHWGNEYQLKASKWQRDTASLLIESGVDIVLGSHPHVIQEIEGYMVEGEMRYVVYSMGNFISNQRNETLGNAHTEDGMMVNFNIRKDNKSGRTDVVDVSIAPTYVHRYTENGAYQYRVLSEDAVFKYDAHVQNRALASFKRTYKQIGN